jgi:hypothetical protein
MAIESHANILYGFAYDCPDCDLDPMPPWYSCDDTDEEGNELDFAGDAREWYLHKIGLARPRPKQTKKDHEQARKKALAALTIEVNSHGGEGEHARTYICVAKSVFSVQGGDAKHPPKMVKGSTWDKDLMSFLTLAGLPLEQKDLGWWVVSAHCR